MQLICFCVTLSFSLESIVQQNVSWWLNRTADYSLLRKTCWGRYGQRRKKKNQPQTHMIFFLSFDSDYSEKYP